MTAFLSYFSLTIFSSLVLSSSGILEDGRDISSLLPPPQDTTELRGPPIPAIARLLCLQAVAFSSQSVGLFQEATLQCNHCLSDWPLQTTRVEKRRLFKPRRPKEEALDARRLRRSGGGEGLGVWPRPRELTRVLLRRCALPSDPPGTLLRGKKTPSSQFLSCFDLCRTRDGELTL